MLLTTRMISWGLLLGTDCIKKMYMIFICSYFQKRNPHVSQLYPPYMFAECIHSHFHLSLRDDILLDTQSGTRDSIRYVIDDNNRFPVPLPVAIPSKDIIHLQFTGVWTVPLAVIFLRRLRSKAAGKYAHARLRSRYVVIIDRTIMRHI